MRKFSQWLRQLQSRMIGYSAKEIKTSPHIQARRGQLGEDKASEYLIKEKGFRIIKRNWSYGKDEIDIIARDAETLVFIEVRARQQHALVSGYHSINSKKKKALRRCALCYLRQMRPRADHYRFDIVEIALQKEDVENIRYFHNIPIFQSHD